MGGVEVDLNQQPSKRPFVVAGTIIRDRAWIAQRHVESLAAQTRRPDALLYLLNDDTPIDDDTVPTLTAIMEGTLAFRDASDRLPTDPYIQRIFVEKYDSGNQSGSSRSTVPRYDIAHLADLRNRFVDKFLSEFPEATHLWSCDSDILPDPDVLERLLQHRSPICAAVVRNSQSPVYNFMCGGTYESPRRAGIEPDVISLPHAELPKFSMMMPVTMTGACVLIARKVLETPEVRYGYHPQGEDVFWCARVGAAGYRLLVNTFARTRHIQPDGTEWDSHEGAS